MTYRIEFREKAKRQLKDLSKVDRYALGRIKTRIDALANNPRPPDVKKLSGTESLYRIRVGDYRIIYEIQDRVLVVLVVKIGRRGDVYRPG